MFSCRAGPTPLLVLAQYCPVQIAYASPAVSPLCAIVVAQTINDKHDARGDVRDITAFHRHSVTCLSPSLFTSVCVGVRPVYLVLSQSFAWIDFVVFRSLYARYKAVSPAKSIGALGVWLPEESRDLR